MSLRDHSEGFEDEDRFSLICAQARQDCYTLKNFTVRRIIAHFAPEFVEKLFERRPCVRQLRYVGCDRGQDPYSSLTDAEDHLKIGAVYESVDFNGATYTLKEYPDEVIGCAFFEWLRSDGDASLLDQRIRQNG